MIEKIVERSREFIRARDFWTKKPRAIERQHLTPERLAQIRSFFGKRHAKIPH